MVQHNMRVMDLSGTFDSPCELPPGRNPGEGAASRLSGRAGLALCLLLTAVAFALDRPVGRALDVTSVPAWDSFASGVSVLGEGWVVALVGVVCAGVFVFCRRPRLVHLVLVVTIAALLTGATATVLRTIIGRTRPHTRAPQGVYGMRRDGQWVAGKYDYGSFPSGHTATVVGLVAALWLANRRAGILASPYAVIVSWSRIAEGNHHFSDVVAAAVLGVYGAGFFVRRLDPLLPALGRWLGVVFRQPSESAAQDRKAAALPGGLAPAALAAAISRLGPAGGDPVAPLLSVVVPAFNEQGNLGPLTAAIARAVEPLALTWEVVVADDCSRDESWQVLAQLGAVDPRIRGVRLARNSGQSAALWAGIKAARGRFVATMDADLQNVPADLPLMLAALEKCDCVCGTRVATRKHGDSAVRRLASRLANGVRNWITRESVSDSGCCYRIFRRECVQDLKFFKGMHRFLPTLIRMEGWTVAEVPITHHPRLSGRSHYGLWDRLLASSYDLLAVRWMQKRMVAYRVAESVNLSPFDPARRPVTAPRARTPRTGGQDPAPYASPSAGRVQDRVPA